MKKLINKIKGFTLTELAIVIAVIAILIAVLVPTFVSLINSANESNDVITVRNMNTVLSTETDGIEKPTDALNFVYEEGGYSVANMTPKSTGRIVYDELTTSFVFIYSDGTTYPEDTTTNLTAYTTWELVSTSDIEPDADGAYHFEESDYANNSIILKGSDWAGKTVYAKYGVELWNDNDTTTTLSSLYINNEEEAQTVDAGSISLAKSAIKTAESADTARNIIVNVKTNHLTYSTNYYNISDHSTVNATLTTDGSGTYYQYGTSAGYDFTKKGGNIVVCNETQAENIKSNNVVIIVDTNDTNSTSVYLSDSTDTLTVTAINEEVETFSVNLNTESVTLTVTDTGSVQVTYTNTDTGLTVEVDLSDDEITSMTECKEAITTGFGTVDYPYWIASEDDYYKINKGTYCKVTADKIKIASAINIASGTEVILDLNGKKLTISGTSSSSHIVNNGTLTITDSSTAKTGTLVVNTANYGITNYGTLYITGGKITGKQVIYLNNSSASLYMTGGTITATGTNTMCYGIYAKQSKEISVTGGTVEVTGGYKGSDWNSDVVSCAIYISNTIIYKNGNLTVSNTTITSIDAGINYTTSAQNDYPTVTISGNSKISAGGYAIYSKNCSVTITDGTYTGNINMTGTETQTAGLTISGGTFNNVSLTTASYGDFSMTGSTLNGVNFVLRNNKYSNVTISECNFYGTSIVTSNVDLSSYFDLDSESYSYESEYDSASYTYTYTITAKS